MNVKKTFTIFIIFSALWFTAGFVLTAFLRLNWLYSGIFAIGIWCVAFAYFHRLSYAIEEEILKISSGILFRRERIVPLEMVLIRTKISVKGKCLLTVLTLSGGRVIVFADVP